MAPSPIERAIELIRREDYDGALAEFSRAEGDVALAEELYGHRGWLLWQRGRFEAAERDYEALVAIRPGDLEARARLGEIKLLIGRPEDAIRTLGSVLAENPAHAVALPAMRRATALIDFRHENPAPDPSSPCQSPAPNAVIASLESSTATFPVSVFPEIGRFLYGFTRLVYPQRMVEIGSHVGYSTICVAQALEDSNRGHLFAFDVFPPLENYTSPVIGQCGESMVAAQLHAEAARLSHRITFTKGDSSSSIRRVFSSGNRIDVAFIDGEHSARGASKDFEAVDEYLVPGGLVLMHDTNPNAGLWLGPRTILERLTEVAPKSWAWVDLPSPEGAGLAIAQKRTADGVELRLPRIVDLVRENLADAIRRRRARG